MQYKWEEVCVYFTGHVLVLLLVWQYGTTNVTPVLIGGSSMPVSGVA